jgi:hypothetical protein
MPSKSFQQQLADLESQLGGEKRYVDLALALVRDKTDETLLYAGGVWDRLDQRFDDREPDRVCVIRLEESQVKFTSWFAEFLRDYREGYLRDVSLALVAGDRRGGKTFDTFFCQIASLIDVPRLANGLPTIGWVISRTYKERDELDQLINGFIPDDFYKAQRAPEFRYTFPHGSYLRNLSADDPQSLKQGRVDFLLYNEPQKMSPKAIKHGLYGTADRGGLTVLAANPPDGPEGDWLRDLKDAIDEDPEIKPITRFFNFSSKHNTKIDQPARKRVAKIAQKIDPDMGDADAEGTWRRWGDLAYPSFNKRPVDHKDFPGLVGPCPTVGVVDMTAAVTRREFGRQFDFIIGGDFQRKPQAAAVMKIIKLPDVAEPVYWFVDCVGTVGTEVELSTDLLAPPHVYAQKSGDTRAAMWVGDCSGSWQGAERIKGRTSFSLLEAEGWFVVPAEIIKGANSERPRNPEVGQRLGLMQRLMEARRIRVAPECTWLVEAFSKCQLRRTDTGTRVPKGQHAHITDAACYAVWRCEPKPGRQGPPPRGALKSVTVRPKGIRVL